MRPRVAVAVAIIVAAASIGGFAALDASAAGSGTPSGQRACRDLFKPTRARAIGALIPTTVSSKYAVLRRAQVPTDVLPANAGLANTLSGSLSAYDPSTERRLASVPGGTLYLVSGNASVFHLTAACRHALPAPLRITLDYRAAHLGTGPAYCLLVRDDSARLSASFCESYAGVMTGYQIQAAPSNPRPGTVLAVVPDGVGAVSFAFASPQPALALNVSNNLASAPEPAAFSRLSQLDAQAAKHPARLRALIAAGLPTSVTWYDAPGGRVVATFPRPASLVDRLVMVFRATTMLLRGATVGGSSGSCTVSTVNGRRVEHCRTCTFQIVNGRKRNVHCMSSTRRTS